MTDGVIKDIAADKEVILAAGAINSPKLLMLSGVGETTALRSLGIDVVENRVLHDIDPADPQS